MVLYLFTSVNYFYSRKYIDADHLCYIYLASYSSPTNLSLESLYLFPLVLSFKLVQKTCFKKMKTCHKAATEKIMPFVPAVHQVFIQQPLCIQDMFGLIVVLNPLTNFTDFKNAKQLTKLKSTSQLQKKIRNSVKRKILFLVTS